MNYVTDNLIQPPSLDIRPSGVTKEFGTTFRNISCAVIVVKYLLVAEQSINS